MKCLQRNGICLLTGLFMLCFGFWFSADVYAEDTTWQDDFAYELDTTNNYIKLGAYSGTASELTVPAKATVDGVEYTTYIWGSAVSGSTSFSGDESLQVLSFEKGIKLGNTLDYLFNNCTNLTSVDVSNLDTSNVTNMDAMFDRCRSLTNLDLSGLDTSSVTRMNFMFQDCSSLTDLNLSSFDTSSVTHMRYMFSGCSSLTKLDVSKFNTDKLKSIEFMFNKCTGLTELDLSNFNTSNVTTMKKMFYSCKGLTSLDLSTFNTNSLTDMTMMFYGCNSLTDLNLNGFNTSQIKDMSSLFNGCNNLTNLDLSSFDTSAVTKMKSMFSGCTNLISLDLSSFNTGAVTTMSDMFRGCSSLTNLDVSGFDTTTVTAMASMFNNCVALTSLDLSGFDTSKVTDMGGMFYGCNKLDQLDISSFNTENVTDMASMFCNCECLTNVDLSSFDTSSVTDMSMMFSGCKTMTSLDLSSFDIGSVTDASNLLYNCSKVQTIRTPKNIFISIALNNTYYDEEYNFYEKLPQNNASSILLTRGPADASAAELEVEAQTYTGSKLEPEITVVLGGRILPEDAYTVAYSNNIKVGTADYTVTFQGNYTGTASGTFEIKQSDGRKAEVTVADQIYTGKALTPSVIVTIDGKTISSANYDLAYEDNTDAGTANVIVTFKNNYSGTVEGTFNIKAKDASGAKVTVPDQVYTGDALTPAVKVVFDGYVIPSDDYTVSYKDNTEVGVATATVTFRNNYQGTARGTFVINRADASKASVTVEDQFYTGEALTPPVTVTLNGKTIPTNCYRVVYRNNIKVGTARIKVYFSRKYTGTAKTTFNITELKISKTAGSFVTVGSGEKETYVVREKEKLTIKSKGITVKKVKWSMKGKHKKYYKIKKLNNKKISLIVKKGGKGKTIKLYAKVTYINKKNKKTMTKTLSHSFKCLGRVTSFSCSCSNKIRVGKSTTLKFNGGKGCTFYFYISSGKSHARLSGKRVTGKKPGGVKIKYKPLDGYPHTCKTKSITVKK